MIILAAKIQSVKHAKLFHVKHYEGARMGAVIVVKEDERDKAALAGLPSDAEIRDDVLAQSAADLRLTEKQKKFVEEWVRTGNATQSAIAAGYNNGNYAACMVEGVRLLSSAKIKKYVNIINQNAIIRAGITPERILREQARIAFCDTDMLQDEEGNPVPLKDLPEDVRRALIVETSRKVDAEGNVEITTKYKPYDKRGALQDLAKAIGMVTDKVAVGGSDDMPAIKTADVSDREAIKALMFKMALHKREQEKNGVFQDAERS